MSHWTERHKVIVAIFILLRRADGKVLLLRRAHTGYMDGRLSMPAGHVDGNESADMAMVREAKEEIGVTIVPSDLRLVHTMHRVAEEGGYEYMDLFFETDTWQGDPQNMEPNKCSELLWADLHKLPQDVIPVVRQALERIVAKEPYSSANFPSN